MAGEPSKPPETLQEAREAAYRNGSAHIPNGLALGGVGEVRRSETLMLQERAFREHWPMTQEERRSVIETALEVMERGLSARDRLRAMMVLVAADNVNVKRERNDITERTADGEAKQAILREMMRSPEARAAFANLAKQKGITVQTPDSEGGDTTVQGNKEASCDAENRPPGGDGSPRPQTPKNPDS